MQPHRCSPPIIAVSAPVLHPVQPDWMCRSCGRVWSDQRSSNGLQWWAEVVGPYTDFEKHRDDEIRRREVAQLHRGEVVQESPRDPGDD